MVMLSCSQLAWRKSALPLFSPYSEGSTLPSTELYFKDLSLALQPRRHEFVNSEAIMVFSPLPSSPNSGTIPCLTIIVEGNKRKEAF